MTLTLSGQVLDDISCRQVLDDISSRQVLDDISSRQVLDDIYSKSPSTRWHLLQVSKY